MYPLSLRFLAPLIAALALLGCGGKVFLDLETGQGGGSSGSGGPVGSSGSATTGTGAGGSGGAGCDVGCKGGCKPVLVVAAEKSTEIALGPEHVFFASGWSDDPQMLHAVTKADGAHSLLFETQDSLRDVVTDGQHVYFIADPTIFRVPAGGGVPEVFLDAPEPVAQIALDATHLYGLTSSLVFSVPLAGGSPQAIATDFSSRFLALDAAHMYWTSGDGAVRKAPKTGGDVQPIAENLPDPRGLAVDDEAVYGVDHDGLVFRTEKNGFGAAPLSKHDGAGNGIAVDATSLYWHADGKLFRMCKSGGEPLVIGDSYDGWGVAVDDEAIYWTTQEGLMKALK